MELKHEQLVYEKQASCFFYVIGNYSIMFLLHKNAPRGCDQMHEEHVC